jgi:hypothetical protein
MHQVALPLRWQGELLKITHNTNMVGLQHLIKSQTMYQFQVKEQAKYPARIL